MKYVIYGVGAIGGAFAACLSRSGVSVAGVARGAQLEALRRDGLLFRTPDGDFRARFPVAEDPAELDIGPDDIILLTMKSQDTLAALLQLRAAGVTTQSIVCAQNGIENERAALRLFPNVYAMTVLLPATFMQPGEVAAFGTPTCGILVVGRYPTGRDAVAEAIAETFDGANFETVVHANAMAAKYSKLNANLLNVLDAAMGNAGRQGPILDAARAEAEAVFAAAGIGVDGAAFDGLRSKVMRMGTIPGAERVGSSTAQSLARGAGSIETDYLNGEIALLGRLHGVPTPVNAGLVALGQYLIAENVTPASMTEADVTAFLESHR